jgi:GNAT superfamily N-acetyltransferase
MVMPMLLDLLEATTIKIRRASPDVQQRIAAFIADWESDTTEHPYDRDVRLLGKGMAAAMPSIAGHRIYLSGVQAIEKEKGHGTAVMRYLCALADKHGVELELRAERFRGAEGGMDTEDLVGWYQRFGFRIVRGEYWTREDGPLMIRKPAARRQAA